MSAAATDFYAAALNSSQTSAAPADGWYLRTENGRRQSLAGQLDRWCGEPDAADRSLLDRAEGTVLDVGCGPGRLVAELNQQGRQALGLDISITALRLARQAGATVVRRSIFEPLPGEGTWGTVLLADGNIGIGGDPVALLRRCRELGTPGGNVLAEVVRPGAGCRTFRIRLERDDEVSDWFDWATVSLDAVEDVAAAAGLRTQEVWSDSDRWFVALRPDRAPEHRGGVPARSPWATPDQPRAAP